MSRSYHLDFLRGLAALLVMSGHIRSYLFDNFEKLGQHDFLANGFYALTGLGHQAVIVFFALSGFLVGGKAFEDIVEHRFSWSRYGLRRLTRLWVVIIPALILTLLFDALGLWLSHGNGYDGRYYEQYYVGPAEPLGIDLSLTTFFGNIAFLQTISVPTFGSNGPLWSLANEFWYYVLFPLFAWTLLGRMSVSVRFAAMCVLFFAAVVLPASLLEGGAIWVAGAAAHFCSRRPSLSPFFRHGITRFVALTAFFVTLALSKKAAAIVGDLELGLVVAALLPVLAAMPSRSKAYCKIAQGISELSYSLYLTHFPLLTLIVMVTLAPARFSPGVFSAGLYICLFLVLLAWAAIVWWCFERNTDRVYSWLKGIGEGRAKQPSQPRRVAG